MDLAEGSETSANINQTPGNNPKDDIINTEHGESLKSRTRNLVKMIRFLHLLIFITVLTGGGGVVITACKPIVVKFSDEKFRCI
jgi:hypothetical protein